MCNWKFGMVSDMCSNFSELSVVHTPHFVFYSNQTSTLCTFVNRYCTTIPRSPSSYTHCTYMYTSIIFSTLVMFWSDCVVSISYIIVLFKLFGELTTSC